MDYRTREFAGYSGQNFEILRYNIIQNIENNILKINLVEVSKWFKALSQLLLTGYTNLLQIF